MIRAVAVLLLVVVWSPILVGAEPTPAAKEAAFRAWLNTRLESSLTHDALTNIKFVVRAVELPIYSDAELRELQSRVEGRPDHPDRHLVAAEQLRRKPGGKVRTFNIWWGNPTQWRINSDQQRALPSAREPVPVFSDAAHRPDGAWQLTQDQLNLAKPASEGPLPGGIEGPEDDVRKIFERLVDGTLTNRRGRLTWEIVHSDFSPPNWSATLRISPEAPAAEVRGVWDQRLQRGFVTERRSPRQADRTPSLFISEIEMYKDWQALSQIGASTLPADIYIARRMDSTTYDGRLVGYYELVSVESVSPAEIDRLTADPDPTGEDPIRGKVTVRSIIDERTAAPRYATRQSPAEQFATLTPEPSATSWFRSLGWIVLGSLVCLFIGLKLRSFTRGQ